MKIAQLHDAFDVCFKASLTPLIVGHAGIGKSQTVKQYADKLGIGFVDLRLGQMSDAADLLGLPNFIDETQETKFFKPSFFPTSGKGIIFLDEINRANKDLLQAVFQLVLDRKINEYTLPEGWMVICAMNPPTEDYDVLDFKDHAFADRFCQIKLAPSPQEWIDFARGKVNSVITDFIAERPELLESDKLKDFSLEVVPTRRSWFDGIGKIMEHCPDNIELQRELIIGLVGVEVAGAFFEYQNNYDRVPKAEEIIEYYDKVKAIVKKNTEEGRSDIAKNICENVEIYLKEKEELTEQNEINIAAFIKDIPVDLSYGFVVNKLFKIKCFQKSNLPLGETELSQELIAFMDQKYEGGKECKN